MYIYIYTVHSPPPTDVLKKPRAHGEHVRAASPAGSLAISSSISVSISIYIYIYIYIYIVRAAPPSAPNRRLEKAALYIAIAIYISSCYEYACEVLYRSIYRYMQTPQVYVRYLRFKSALALTAPEGRLKGTLCA